MSPWLLAVPIGAAAVYFLWPKSPEAAGAAYVPPPGQRASGAGGSRAISYLQRLDAALLAYRGTKLIGGAGAASALAELRGTLDVVKGMAEQDLLQGRILKADMDAIDAKINGVRKQIG